MWWRPLKFHQNMWNSKHYVQFPLEIWASNHQLPLQYMIPLVRNSFVLFPFRQVAPTVQWYSSVRLCSSCWLQQAFVCVLAGFWSYSCCCSLTVYLTVLTLTMQVHNFPLGGELEIWCSLMVLGFSEIHRHQPKMKKKNPNKTKATSASMSEQNSTVN